MAVVDEVANHYGNGQIANGHGVGARVHAPVEGDRLVVYSRDVFIGGLIDEAAPLEFF